MTEPPGNDELLSPEGSAMTSLPASSRGSPPQNPRSFVIEPPLLPIALKDTYKMSLDTSLKPDDLKVDEVIGEYHVDGVLYYFARYAGGIAYKYPSHSFSLQFKELVVKYKQQKDAGDLPPFDPSASYVHPLSRVTMVINFSKRYGTTVRVSSARTTSSVDAGDVTNSQEEDEGVSDSQDDEEDEVNMFAAPRSRRKSTAKAKRVLPFSPKKTRSRRIPVIDSDPEASDIDEAEPRPIRRSTRSKKGVKVNLDTEAYSDDLESEGKTSDSYGSRKAKSKKPKKAVRPKAARPAYGHFRSVADLNNDFSDDENMTVREHRDICEKCHRAPGHKLIEALKKKSKVNGKKRKKTSDDEFEVHDDEQSFTALGGWVRCLKCPVVAHWRCLAATQRDEILKAAMDKDREEWQRSKTEAEATGNEATSGPPSKRPGLDISQTTEFICGGCMKGGVCMGCMEIAIEPDSVNSKCAEDKASATGDVVVVMPDNDQDTVMKPKSVAEGVSVAPQTDHASLFRCFTCKRVAHYEHLPLPPTLSADADLDEIVEVYTRSWLCADCSSYTDGVDKVIAWRPYPPNAVEPPHSADETPNYKRQLPREYLVKWMDRSYGRVQWVPHMWLLSTHQGKLRNFFTGGSKVELLKAVEEERNDVVAAAVFEIGDDSRASSAKPGAATPFSPLEANPDAERYIPMSWKTVDRVLDVFLWRPSKRETKSRSRRGDKGKANVVMSDDDMGDIDESVETERNLAFESGEQPSMKLMESISDWEQRTQETFTIENISQVVWAFFKWNDLGYDEATWDSPPRPEDVGYQAFQTAMKRFLDSRSVIVLKRPKDFYRHFDKRAKDDSRQYLLEDASHLQLGQNPDLKLMPFQVDGFNWLFHNWWIHQHCILADEMGLGKTVQIATFLGHLVTKFHAFPALVVVPNSTITNWVREFERWAPNLRVVPFYGEAKAREVIKKFELSHDGKRRDGSKYHVLITTYEALINLKDFTPVFKNQPRWEVLVIDEGQRLKSDTSLLFKKLNELNSVHRIIMTGTPLNNNIRELFNLMNFLDPNEWNDLEAMEKEHEELTEELVKQLHNRLRPYFLRRLKADVLQLPPKNEVIVPLSMAPLQKQVYRSILSHNLDLLNGLTQPSGSKPNGAVNKGKLNNVLMHLRKCLQHPYLYAEDIEPRGLSNQETHEKLIDGSTKLRLLKALLPKLKARGHRVLLFSQFVIALNIVEDFLAGEGYKFLRLDGNTKGSERQKDMDVFNKPGSDVFIYLLTTRAGGVGINLFSADTVIIFDPDFNPHQDLQAIARAYRFGQQKTCLVFKLMVKDSAEERIVQVGKKKLVLDHLIVQKMDDEDSGGENVQSILTFGAQALFDADSNSRDITYSDNDIDKLIERTEKEGEQEEPNKEGALSFSFAKIWEADKDSLAEVVDQDQSDSWAQTLAKITAEQDQVRNQEIAHSGRGVRRRAAIAKPNAYVYGTPTKEKTPRSKSTPKSGASNDSEFSESNVESDNDSSNATSAEPEDGSFNLPSSRVKAKAPSRDLQYCGLCAMAHADGPGQCFMTDRSEHLAEFREMLLLHADDEPWEQRQAAIIAIDETLYRRGRISLIQGQPLNLLPKVSNLPNNTVPATTQTKRANELLSFAGPVVTQQIRETQSLISAPDLHQPRPSLKRPSTTETPIQAVAGPSKRPASPLPDREPKKKKPVLSSCVICGQSPHRVKNCPVVAEGPKSISKQIKRLENNTDPISVIKVQSLRKILAKQTGGNKE